MESCVFNVESDRAKRLQSLVHSPSTLFASANSPSTAARVEASNISVGSFDKEEEEEEEEEENQCVVEGFGSKAAITGEPNDLDQRISPENCKRKVDRF